MLGDWVDEVLWKGLVFFDEGYDWWWYWWGEERVEDEDKLNWLKIKIFYNNMVEGVVCFFCFFFVLCLFFIEFFMVVWVSEKDKVFMSFFKSLWGSENRV